jgi:hypothetical protein
MIDSVRVFMLQCHPRTVLGSLFFVSGFFYLLTSFIDDAILLVWEPWCLMCSCRSRGAMRILEFACEVSTARPIEECSFVEILGFLS